MPSSTGSPLPATKGPSLSPSRAADFKTCPLLFRFRTIDRLPEQPTRDQVRGTLVHAVLERLFDLPAGARTPDAAVALVRPEWERLLAQEPELSALFDDPAVVPVPLQDGPLASAPVPGPTTPGPDAGHASADSTASRSAASGPAAVGAGVADAGVAGAGLAGAGLADAGVADLAGRAGGDPGGVLPGMPEMPAEDEAARLERFLKDAGDLLAGYFAVEDPNRLEPAERESLISTLVDDELLIRGYIDRLDVSPAGDLRVVDYKTGGAPREAFEGRALFQLKFYALVLWRTRGVVPRVLRLLYLKDAEALDYSPDAEELERFERTLLALSRAIEQAKEQRDFRPKPSRLCGWCSHQAFCPEFGGTPPPYPEPATTARLAIVPAGPAPDGASPQAGPALPIARTPHEDDLPPSRRPAGV
ncbi:RecB family exonuclease [Actinoplanes sp. RD1]|uniref:RecB family exonuclease n=1 Tax=Actinoplanes sp. RD1 TaxID=3064538 RepID=UPI003558B336